MKTSDDVRSVLCLNGAESSARGITGLWLPVCSQFFLSVVMVL